MHESLKQADEAVHISLCSIASASNLPAPQLRVWQSVLHLLHTTGETANKFLHPILENTLLGGLVKANCSLNENTFGTLTENCSKPIQMV